MEKSRVLVVGGTGYLGRRIVKASLAAGHPTFVLHRPEIGIDVEKASFSDHGSLVAAVRQVDAVVCAIAGVHIRSHQIPLQLKLVEAMKEAGNVKRFLPSEFGIDPARMGSALEPGRITFDDKMAVRRAVEEAGIPFTYISAGCFAGYFIGGLCQPGNILPAKERVTILGSGDVKAIFVDEDDIATYAVKTIDDPRAANKTVYIRPPENVLSQMELVRIWEDLIERKLETVSLSADDFLSAMKGEDYVSQVGMGHFYHVLYEGCLTNFDVAEEASQLYPDVAYTRVRDYLRRYL
ncbi:unnamed protein product [Spirodela intermedia]|uniref:NmrA-like domain-containing protein n=1 Tax=Spirodela intermedia TaxID=51605 RepID=A0A7I8KCI0_SPIIN|nr:unnamed protein product [Spirodela intermedia]